MNEKIQVLIVDDNPSLLEVSSWLLSRAGYDVIEACTGEGALRQAREHKPSLILLDVILPDINGVEVCRRIKDDPTLAGSYVILISGLEIASESQAQGLESGADDYIARPVSDRELLARVNATLRLKQAEDALHASEMRFRHIFENAPIGIYRTTPDGQILLANPTLVEMLGYGSFEELAQRNLESEGYPSEYPRSRFKKLVESEGEVTGLESAWTRKGGSTLFVRENARTVRDEDGKVLYYEGTVEDITERRQMEKALRESERALSTLMSNLPGIAYRCHNDRDWTMEFISEGCLKLTGYPPSDLVHNYKLSYAQVIHPDDRETVWNDVQAALRKDSPFQLTYRIIMAEGKEKWVWEQGRGVPEVNGEVLLEGFITDITERHEAEEKLQRERDLVARLMETSPVCITMVNSEGRITFANARAEEVLGLTPDKVTQRTYRDPEWHITDYQGEPFPEEKLPFRQVMETGQAVHDVRHAIEWPDGRRVLLSINGAPLFDEMGRLEGAVFAIEDVTERMQVQDELQRHREHLEALVEERTAELRSMVDLMSGREVRMAQLKKVIKQLRTQLKDAGLEPVADDPLLRKGS